MLLKEESLKNFAPNLKIRRKNAHLSQTQVAKILGISPSTYISYERGKSYPTLPNLIKILHLFGVSIEDLMRDVPSASYLRHMHFR